MLLKMCVRICFRLWLVLRERHNDRKIEGQHVSHQWLNYIGISWQDRNQDLKIQGGTKTLYIQKL